MKTQRRGLFSTHFALVCASGFLIAGGNNMIIPVLPPYVLELGGDDRAIGFVIGFGTLFSLICRLAIGHGLDAWGRRPFLLVGGLALLASGLLFGQARGITMLGLTRMIHAIGFGAGMTAANVLCVDLAPPGRRAEAIAVFSMFPNLAIALAPGGALWLLHAQTPVLSGYSLVFAGLVVLAIVLIATSLLVKETRPNRAPMTPQTKARLSLDSMIAFSAIPAAISMSLMAAAYAAIATFLPVYAAPDAVGTFFVVYALVTLASRPFTGIAADRMPAWKVAIPGMALVGAGLGLLATSNNMATVIAAAVIFGFGWGVFYPCLMLLAAEAVKPSQRGAAMSTFSASLDFGTFFGASSFGIIAHAYGYKAVFMAASGATVVSILYLIFHLRSTAGRRGALERLPVETEDVRGRR